MVSQGEKQQVAVRIPIRQKAELEREAAERGISRSEYIRSILSDRHRADKLRQNMREKEERIKSREMRIEQLEKRIAETRNIEEKIEDLPDKIRDTSNYRERRQKMLDQASFAERVKWKITGVPVED